jgi:phage repressor protein C with HTH and peptisase S24 domain
VSTDFSKFSEVVSKRLEELGQKVGTVERSAGLKPDTIRNILRADSESGPQLSTAREVCDALGLELYIAPKKAHQGALDVAEDQLGELLDPGSPVRTAARLTELHHKVVGQDFDPIPRYDVFLAAGDGALNDNNTPVEHLAFSKAWLKRMNVEPGMAALLSVRGESMQPTLFDGDLVLVDRNRFTVQSGKIYAFVDGDDGARVKRLRLFGNAGLVIQSDNHSSEFEDEERSGQEMQNVLDNIIGEVLWSGHTWD